MCTIKGKEDSRVDVLSWLNCAYPLCKIGVILHNNSKKLIKTDVLLFFIVVTFPPTIN